jgi:hypothetical protein
MNNKKDDAVRMKHDATIKQYLTCTIATRIIRKPQVFMKFTRSRTAANKQLEQFSFISPQPSIKGAQVAYTAAFKVQK